MRKNIYAAAIAAALAVPEIGFAGIQRRFSSFTGLYSNSGLSGPGMRDYRRARIGVKSAKRAARKRRNVLHARRHFRQAVR